MRIGAEKNVAAHKEGTSPTLRILMVDDHSYIRKGVRNIIQEQYPAAVFGEASNAHEALDLAWKEKWSVILLDITLPGRGGLDVLKDLKNSQPRTPIIVLSMHSEEQFAIRVLKLGAASFIRKDSAPKELVSAIEHALRGSKYITATTAQELALHVDQDGKTMPHEQLSNREFQVMRFLAFGKTVKEIASELSLSAKTISTYRTRILEKMELRNNSELMRYAVRHGIVDV